MQKIFIGNVHAQLPVGFGFSEFGNQFQLRVSIKNSQFIKVKLFLLSRRNYAIKNAGKNPRRVETFTDTPTKKN